MGLQDFFNNLPQDQRQLQLGVATNNPLCYGFPRKRVVHAGLLGTMMSPTEMNTAWHRLMDTSPTATDLQAI